MHIRQFIYSFLLLAIFVASLLSDAYFSLVYYQLVLIIFMILDKLGKGIVLRELIAFHATVFCLVFPILGYLVYDRNDALAQLWVRYMPISSDRYFEYSLPAISSFSFAITLPYTSKNENDFGKGLENIIYLIRRDLKEKNNWGVIMTIIGVVMFYLSNKVPISLQFIFNLFWFSSFTGFLYIYYSKNIKFRKLLLACYAVFVIAYSLNSGMFTIIAYMGMLLFSFIFLGNKISFFKKTFFLGLALLALILIQSVKPAYRQMTWKQNYEGNKVSLFTNLVIEKLSKGEIFSKEAFFPIYYRGNQGFNVALVMKRIPKFKSFDGGERLAVTFFSSFVPRIMWPDKPEAGGKFNMKYYVGFNIVGYSTNIGTLGEAYGSFGVYGGILYMFLLGLFIRFTYFLLFRLANKIPLLLLWMPVLFFQITYSAEADTLQIMNSLIKGSFFVLILFQFLPKIFLGIKKIGKQEDNLDPKVT